MPCAASRRDRAILLLLMRLGLRAVEVARLDLDDLDWHRGEVVIRGKGRRDERLPLPFEVGEAIVAYLRHDRPSVLDRTLFINVRVPYSPMTAGAVKAAVVAAAGRAGLAQVSAHRLRHTFAVTTLLGWYRSDADVAARLPLLSTYLGHVDPGNTYWYLTATPELMQMVAQRLDQAGRAS